MVHVEILVSIKLSRKTGKKTIKGFPISQSASPELEQAYYILSRII